MAAQGWRKEDWVAVYLGALILVLVLAGMRPALPTFSWATDAGFAAAVAENKPAAEQFARDAAAKGEADLAAAVTALKSAMDTATGRPSATKKMAAAGK